jgi:tripartite motif-containing protein 71
MTIKRTLILLLVGFVMYSCSISVSQEYHVVKIWPEVPQGWSFYTPQGVAVDKSGNVYIGDRGNYCIKKFDTEGRLITQWGDPGQKDGQFSGIDNIEVDNSGIVYVLETDFTKWENCRIQKFTTYGQFIGALERKASDTDNVKWPIDLATDDKGNIFVLAVEYIREQNCTGGVRVEKYMRDGEFVSQWKADPGSGDGQLQRPNAIAVDVKGNIYVIDEGNHRVQKFDSSGKFLMKWGGQGKGNGLFSSPRGIAVDNSGNIYIVDRDAVQKFTSEGEFLARWEKGGGGSAIALDSHSDVYVTSQSNQSVSKFDHSGNLISVWGSAGSGDGRFMQPKSVATDQSGYIIVADVMTNHIQRFTSEGQFVCKWGRNTYFGVYDIAIDESGNLFVACVGSDEIQKFDPDGKLICRWGSTGSGDGQFKSPWAIAIGPLDNVYVADTFNCRVQKFTSNGKFLKKWGTQGIGDGQFSGLFFISADASGNVWVGDQLVGGTHRMQKFDSNGKFLTKWTKKIMTPPSTFLKGAVAIDSSGNSYYVFENRIDKYDSKGDLVNNYSQEEFTGDKFERVFGLCVDRAGCLYVTGGKYYPVASSIWKFDTDGKLMSCWTAENMEGNEQYPNGPIAVDRAGNIYVSAWTQVPIWKLSSNGKPVVKFKIEPPSCEDFFYWLGGVAVNNSGNVDAVDSVDVDWKWGIPSIKEFNLDGQLVATWDMTKTAEGKIKYPTQMAMDVLGNAYVTDKSSHCVHKLNAQGKYIKSWGTKGTGDGQFDSPEGIAVDGSDDVYVCDRQNSRVQKFDSDGKFLAKWGEEGSEEGEFHFPAAIAIDKQGFIYVADSDNNRIQKFSPKGEFLTKWGDFGEQPGQFRVPLGIAVDAAGNVYVSDSHNHRIQKFAPIQP